MWPKYIAAQYASIPEFNNAAETLSSAIETKTGRNERMRESWGYRVHTYSVSNDGTISVLWEQRES